MAIVDDASRFGYTGPFAPPEPKMKVDELTIENFRGIRALQMPFHPRVNLIVGINGSGKSTLLDCVATLLGRFVDKLRATGGRGAHIDEDDITLGALATKITLAATHDAPGRLAWSIAKVRSGYKADAATDLKELEATVDRIQSDVSAHPGTNIPLVAHYPTNRAVLQIPERIRTKHKFEQMNAFDEALTGAPDNFKLFFEWFRLREDIENERFREAYEEKAPELAWKDRQLNAVRAAIPAFLDGFSDLRIRRSPGPMRLMVKKDNAELAVDQLSDGEKCLLALVGDLARRLAIANPSLSDPLTGSGVIMIDEIDLHLHPSWQRKVIPALETTFPGCQLILTTHSPQIIAHAQAECIRTLHREGDNVVWSQPEASFGMDSNRVLSEIMGTDERPREIKVALEELFALIGQGDLEGAKRFVAGMQSAMRSFPEVVKAETLIHRKEILKR
ncbi:MAG: AAA family ATPase [Byssovorax sp.]